MKKILMLLATFLLVCGANAQTKALRLSDEEYEATYEEMKKSDDFTIRESGYVAGGIISSFTKTLPNLCKIVWKSAYVDGGDECTITSLDGDVFEGKIRISDDHNYELKNLYTNKNSHYKPITRNTRIEDMPFLGESWIDGILTFADSKKFPIKISGRERIICVPLTNPGDYYEQIQSFDTSYGTWKNEGTDSRHGFRITIEEGVLTCHPLSYDHNRYVFTLVYNNGDIYDGDLQFSNKFYWDEDKNNNFYWDGDNDDDFYWDGDNEGYASNIPQFDRSKLKNVTKLADMGRLYNGDIKTKSGKLKVILNGEEDEFEALKREKAAKAKIEQEKETKAQIAQLNQRYGKKYVDMLIKGQIGVGMPEDLFNLGVNTNSFNSFDTCAVSIDYGHGDRCLDLYKFQSSLDFKPVGHIWIRNGVISSISWY